MNTACRSILRFSLALSLCTPMTWGGTINGSTTTTRSNIDTSVGQVVIYTGGFFDSGQRVTTFSLLDDLSSGNRLLTPILFEQTSPGLYTVRGVGTGETVPSPNVVQSFDFGLVFGTNVTSNANFTFGFITALVNGSGTQTSSSAGAVDLSPTVIAGTGVGGVGTTNDWRFTPSLANITIGLGTTFGAAGNFALNSGSGSFNTDRTYSATLDSVSAGVPEPGSFTLAAIGGVLLAGVALRQRRIRIS
jgi:PEP-CTERM motif